jgi:hypothetical protein
MKSSQRVPSVRPGHLGDSALCLGRLVVWSKLLMPLFSFSHHLWSRVCKLADCSLQMSRIPNTFCVPLKIYNGIIINLKLDREKSVFVIHDFSWKYRLWFFLKNETNINSPTFIQNSKLALSFQMEQAADNSSLRSSCTWTLPLRILLQQTVTLDE